VIKFVAKIFLKTKFVFVFLFHYSIFFNILKRFIYVILVVVMFFLFSCNNSSNDKKDESSKMTIDSSFSEKLKNKNNDILEKDIFEISSDGNSLIKLLMKKDEVINIVGDKYKIQYLEEENEYVIEIDKGQYILYNLSDSGYVEKIKFYGKKFRFRNLKLGDTVVVFSSKKEIKEKIERSNKFNEIDSISVTDNIKKNCCKIDGYNIAIDPEFNRMYLDCCVLEFFDKKGKKHKSSCFFDVGLYDGYNEIDTLLIIKEIHLILLK